MTLTMTTSRRVMKGLGNTLLLLMMLWTAPTTGIRGAKLRLLLRDRQRGAVHERSYHDRP